MISVSIAINGEPIMARSAVNRLREVQAYVCDDGTLIKHNPDDGAVVLAIKMLKTIKDNPDKVTKTCKVKCKTCGQKYVPDWKDGDCITCARDKILGKR